MSPKIGILTGRFIPGGDSDTAVSDRGSGTGRVTQSVDKQVVTLLEHVHSLCGIISKIRDVSVIYKRWNF